MKYSIIILIIILIIGCKTNQLEQKLKEDNIDLAGFINFTAKNYDAQYDSVPNCSERDILGDSIFLENSFFKTQKPYYTNIRFQGDRDESCGYYFGKIYDILSDPSINLRPDSLFQESSFDIKLNKKYCKNTLRLYCSYYKKDFKKNNKKYNYLLYIYSKGFYNKVKFDACIFYENMPPLGDSTLYLKLINK